MVAGFREELHELGKTGRIVGDAFLGDQLTALVNDGDIVMGFGPVDAAEQCHV